MTSSLKAVFSGAVRSSRSRFDTINGGFAGAAALEMGGPRFPRMSEVRMLQRLAALETRVAGPVPRSGYPAIEMARGTLHVFGAGALRDHIGCGFHRYALDPTLAAPAFEKTLADNALLAATYACTYRATGTKEFRTAAESALKYITGTLDADHGAFAASQRAWRDTAEGWVCFDCFVLFFKKNNIIVNNRAWHSLTISSVLGPHLAGLTTGRPTMRSGWRISRVSCPSLSLKR
jgi:uncharacterized protein YyaL (SSP411 family)